MKYQKPFKVVNKRIYDKDGKEVRLWGANYYAPFNHNFVNIEEMGLDHYESLEKDIAEFKRLGIDLIRMHVYEREISDEWGHLVENERLKVFDYLIERLYQEGIYVMMTPIVWYNTVALQKTVTDNYAYWSINSCENFGFSNFYTAHEMIWNEKAIQAQETYLDEFFSHVNAFSKRKFYEYENVVVIEVTNEAIYPTAQMIDDLRKRESVNPYHIQEREIVTLYDNYVAENNLEDCTDTKEYFCADLVYKYLCRTFGIVDKYYGDTVVKSHIFYQFNSNKYILGTLEKAPINAISVTAYAPQNYDSDYNDHFNILGEMRELIAYYEPLTKLNKAFVCYEFDTPSTLKGYPYAAFGYFFAALGVQIATYFTYTPADVSEYNPGWIIHYFSMCHTPDKAAAFMAGKNIFERLAPYGVLPESDDFWEYDKDGLSFEICRSTNHVGYYDNEKLIYCGGYDKEITGIPALISGTGNCSIIKREGNGLYFMEKNSENEYQLTLLPSQKYVNDPLRGKSFATMSNRYINVNKESVVSRLLMKPEAVEFNFNTAITVYDKNQNEMTCEDGAYRLRPGTYKIVLK